MVNLSIFFDRQSYRSGWKHDLASSLERARTKRVAGDSGVRITLSLVLVCASTLNWAQETSTDSRFAFDIPQQRADQALTEFAEQADITLMVPHELVRDKAANALVGEYTLEEGAQVLLEGTGLVPEFSNPIVMSILLDDPSANEGDAMVKGKQSRVLALLMSFFAGSGAAGEEPAESARLEEIEEILVVGRPIEGYRATDALTGTKIGALLRDLPISATVLPHQLIDDRRINYLGEALDNVSGVQRKLGYAGTQNFGAYIRGFDAGFVTLRNGFRDYGWYTMRDIANVERFEVLKGPASILYGALQPGGITNTVTKQPVVQPLLNLGVTIGSDAHARGELDSGGALSNELFYRLNLAYEDSESYRDLVTTKSWFLAPVISWVPNSKTRWTGEIEAKSSEFTWDLGLPRSIEVLSVPPSRFLGEADGMNDVDSFLVSSVLEHDVSAEWTFRQNLQFSTAGGDYVLRSPLAVLDDGRTVFREAYDSPADSESYDIQHEFVGDLELFGLRSQAIVGLQFYKMVDTYDFELQPLASIDLFEPAYGAMPDPGFPLFGNEVTSEAWALYVQDLISISPRVKVLVGARYDEVRTTNYDRLGETTIHRGSDSAVSPQVGVVFQPTSSTSLYASYSTSFMPFVFGRTVDGSALDPEEGLQYEVGIKQELADDKLSITLAAYSITKENVRAADLDNPGFSVQIGEQKSKGVELDIFGSITPQWDIIFGASYIDAYVSQDTVLPTGTPLDNAPEWSGNLWTKFSIDNGPLRGFRLGAGVYGATERQVSSFFGVPLFDLPSYVRVDAMVEYQADRWSVQLNGKNLTDEVIYDLMGTTIMPQQPRSWFLSVRANIL